MTHKVTTDALETLGTILPSEQGRDAIHLAVISVEASHDLRPGERIEIRAGEAYSADTQCHGIVDPFLRKTVLAGEFFWCVINPRTINSLRHVWTHPELPDESPLHSSSRDGDAEQTARRAIHAIAVDLGVSDEALMKGAAHWLEGDGGYDNYMHFGYDLNYGWDMEAFWSAYALLTGKDVPEGMRGSFFSCSC